MEPGFTVARTESATPVTHWVEGKPEYGFFGGIKTSGKKLMPVETYRCTGCGYLEAYAHPAKS